MKIKYSIKYFCIITVGFVFFFNSCKKIDFITSPDAFLRISEDTLHFDTVFTTLGSTTQYLKIFNANDQKLKLSSLQLMGGSASFFKLNVDGISGTNFTNIELEANDSIYLFSTVRIDPNLANLPFLVRDSIKIEFNGNTKWIQLEAFGKNARFMRNVIITSDSTITNSLPIIILGSLTVNENKILTIQKGTKIYVHPNAPININGTLNAIGDTAISDKIIFQGIRLDYPYNEYPGSWPYIYFSPKSKNNKLQHCIIKNAYQGLVVDSMATNSNPKLILEQCIFDNIYDRALIASNSTINASNCLISNVGYGLYIVSGGNYNFNHCTFTSLSNYYLTHKESLITLSNTNSAKTYSNSLSLILNNSIIYGQGGFVENEIVIPVLNNTVAFNVSMSNILYNQKTIPTNITFTNALRNVNPLFKEIDISKRIFNFKLQNTSPCIDAATSTVFVDLEGKPRPVGPKPDIGCYEKQ